MINSYGYYCGYLNNMINNQRINHKNMVLSVHNDFCISASNCFIELPFLCEINCTNQEAKCSKWVKGT